MKKLTLPFRVKKPILACGADLKGAFALAKGKDAYLFDGFGDLSDLDNLTRYSKAASAAQKKLKIRPQVVVCDMHPGYFSTQFAEDLQLKDRSLKLYRVQHHEAHIASAILDNDIKGNVFGAAFDGTGYGLDGNIWGGEFFAGNIRKLKRVAHLGYIPMPGADMCVRQPWRMAASYLYSAFGPDFLKLKIDFVKSFDKKSWAVLREMIDKRMNSPLASGVGRLFDAAGSIILNKKEAKFEAELPMKLEEIAAKDIDDSYGASGSSAIIRGIVRDIKKNVSAGVISAKFHNSVAMIILKAAKKAKIKNVVLSGGVFQNRYLKRKVPQLLSDKGFRVYAHLNIETNDSGIPIGQIAITNERLLCA